LRNSYIDETKQYAQFEAEQRGVRGSTVALKWRSESHLRDANVPQLKQMLFMRDEKSSQVRLERDSWNQ
jgi:hypothetical protein